jgi:hypothetical protein
MNYYFFNFCLNIFFSRIIFCVFCKRHSTLRKKKFSHSFFFVEMSKQEIFDFFYSVQQVSRSGGGKPKAKMTRRSDIPLIAIDNLKKMITSDNMDYFNKLLNRDPNLAPPPRPS